MIEIYQVDNVDKLEQARTLWKGFGDFLKNCLGEYSYRPAFIEYFRAYKQEINHHLPGEYEPPEGCLMLAMYQGESVGSVGLRKLDESICEMRRLFVRPEFRGLGIGRTLAEAIIEHGHILRYTAMRLNTNQRMTGAIEMYRSLGFIDIEPYEHFDIDGMCFLELKVV